MREYLFAISNESGINGIKEAFKQHLSPTQLLASQV